MMPVNYTNPTNTTPANLSKLKAIAASVGEEITNIEVHEPKILEYELTYDVVNPNHLAICKPDALNRFLYLAHVAITYGCLETPLNELMYDEANLRAKLLCAYYSLHKTLNYDPHYSSEGGLENIAKQIATYTSKGVTVKYRSVDKTISDNDASVLGRNMAKINGGYFPFIASESNVVMGKITHARNPMRTMSASFPEYLYGLFGYTQANARFFNTRCKRVDTATLSESFAIEMIGYLHILNILDSSLEYRDGSEYHTNWELLPSCELPMAFTIKDKAMLDLFEDKTLAPVERDRVSLYESVRDRLELAKYKVIKEDGNLLIPYGLIMQTCITNELSTYVKAIDVIINRLGVDIEVVNNNVDYDMTKADSINKALDYWYDNSAYSNQYNHLFIEIDLEERKTSKRSL